MDGYTYLSDVAFLDPVGRWIYRLSLLQDGEVYCFREMRYDLKASMEVGIPDELFSGKNLFLKAQDTFNERFFALKRREWKEIDGNGSICVLRSVESDKHIYGVSLDGEEMVVLCNNNFGITDKFDKGQEYILLNETDEFFVVENKFGESEMCNKDRFKRKLVLM